MNLICLLSYIDACLISVSFLLANTGAYFLKTGLLVRLSQQELMDCSWGEGNNACDGGEDFRAYQWIQKHGQTTEQQYGQYTQQVYEVVVWAGWLWFAGVDAVDMMR